MNKKAIAPALVIPLAIGIVIVVLGLIFGFAALFSTSYLFYIIGGSMIALTLIYVVPAALQGNFTIQKRNFLIVMILIGAVFIILPLTGVTQQGLGPQYIQVPVHGWYKCEQASSPVFSPSKILPSGVNAIKCPTNTDKCDIVIQAPQISGVVVVTQRGITKEFAINTNAGSIANLLGITNVVSSSSQVTITNVAKDETVGVRYYEITSIFGFPTGLKDSSASKYYSVYNPFILRKYSIFSGVVDYTEIRQGCTFTAGEASELVKSSTVTGLDRGTSEALTGIEPFKTRNFVDNIIPISVENAKIQVDEYCMNNKLYPIQSLTLGSTESYRVVNTNVVTGQVECCNGDVEPGIRQCQNNQWEYFPDPGVPSTVECSLFRPCTGNDNVPFTDTSLVRSVCEDNVCVQRTTAVECTNNNACPIGQTCDTKLWKCVDVPSPVVVTLNITNEDDCRVKAEESPLLGYTWVETTEARSVWNIISFGLIDRPKTTAHCKATFVPYYIAGGIILILGGLIIVLLFTKTKKVKK